MTRRTLGDSAFLIAVMTTTLAILVNGGCSSTEPDKPGTNSPVTMTDAGSDGSSMHACPGGLPLPKTPCFTCDPVPPGGDAGCGGPLPKLWGFDGSGIPGGVSYPVGCTVLLPVENPYYPGGPQGCQCSTFAMPSPGWTCGI
jgi:hypothetical protein